MRQFLLNFKTSFLRAGVHPRHYDIRNLFELFAKKNGISVSDIPVHGANDPDLLSIAVENSMSEIAKMLLIKGAIPDSVSPGYKPPLISATENNDFELVESLINHGANVEVTYCGATPLSIACVYGHFDIAKVLLGSGADPNKIVPSDTHAESPIFFTSCEKTMEVLIRHGCNLNHQNKRQETVLHKSIIDGRSNRCIDVLLNNGIDVTICNNRGQNAFHLAMQVRNSDALELLMKHQDFENRDEILLQSFMKAGHDIDTCSLECNLILNVLLKNVEISFIERDHLDDCSVKRFIDKASLIGFRANNASLPISSTEEDSSNGYLSYAMMMRNMELLFRSEYEKELNKLKNVSLDEDIVLYDLLFYKRNRMARILNNANLRKVFEDHKRNFSLKFPTYGQMLTHKVKKGHIRKKLMQQAQNRISQILASYLPENVNEKILEFFSEGQLNRFAAADWSFLDSSV